MGTKHPKAEGNCPKKREMIHSGRNDGKAQIVCSRLKTAGASVLKTRIVIPGTAHTHPDYWSIFLKNKVKDSLTALFWLTSLREIFAQNRLILWL